MSEKSEETALLEWWWGRLPNMDPHAAAMVEELLRALGQILRTPQPVTPAGGEVEPENGPLPRPLWDHEKEWYTLCERAPHADSIKISGQLAEAIIEAVCRAPIKTTPAELNAEYARGRADGWEAHPPVADAALLCFVAEVMDEWHEGDLDGGQRQDLAEKHGLLIPTEVTESCGANGEHCACAEYGDFPQTCYRPSPLLLQCRAALNQRGGGDHA